MKKFLIVLVLTASITGCVSYPVSSEYPRAYYKPYPAYWYEYHQAYRYTPHHRYYRW
jgi:hypothetical protein